MKCARCAFRVKRNRFTHRQTGGNAFTCVRDLKPQGQVEPLALLLTLSIMLAKPVSD